MLFSDAIKIEIATIDFLRQDVSFEILASQRLQVKPARHA